MQEIWIRSGKKNENSTQKIKGQTIQCPNKGEKDKQ
jgi:hypothetical protein